MASTISLLLIIFTLNVSVSAAGQSTPSFTPPVSPRCATLASNDDRGAIWSTLIGNHLNMTFERGVDPLAINITLPQIRADQPRTAHPSLGPRPHDIAAFQSRVARLTQATHDLFTTRMPPVNIAPDDAQYTQGWDRIASILSVVFTSNADLFIAFANLIDSSTGAFLSPLNFPVFMQSKFVYFLGLIHQDRSIPIHEDDVVMFPDPFMLSFGSGYFPLSTILALFDHYLCIAASKRKFFWIKVMLSTRFLTDKMKNSFDSMTTRHVSAMDLLERVESIRLDTIAAYLPRRFHLTDATKYINEETDRLIALIQSSPPPPPAFHEAFRDIFQRFF